MAKAKSKRSDEESRPPGSPDQSALYHSYIFMTGAVTLSLELLASRILTPYFGVSLFIWSGILSITLIALSLGYYIGGRTTRIQPGERHFTLAFLFLLMPTLSGISIAGSCLLYPKIFHTLGSNNLVAGAYLACMLLIFLPLIAVSAMNPLLIAIQNERQSRGSQAGDSGSGLVFFVSTVGSVIGVSLTAFVFIPNLTNFNSMLILAAILSSISLTGGLTSSGLADGERNRLLGVAGLGIVISLGLLAYAPSYLKKNESIRFGGNSWTLEREYTSMFGNTKILTIVPDTGASEASGSEKKVTYYYNDGITQNIIDPEGHSLTPFTYALEFLSLGLRPDAKDVLMLGLGAGIIPMRLADKGVSVDVVEINPSSIQAAEDYFGFDPSRANVVMTDARTYVRNCPKAYDVVLIDMSHGDGLPEYLLSREFFTDVRSCLTRDGIAVFNTFTSTQHLAAYYHIVKTLGAVFPHLLMYHDGLEDGKLAINIYLAGLQRPNANPFERPTDLVPPSMAEILAKVFSQSRPIDTALLAQAQVLEDEFNPFSFLNIESDQFFRKSVLVTLPPEFLVN